VKKLVLIVLLIAGFIAGQGDLRNKINVIYSKNSVPKKEERKKIEFKISNIEKKNISLKRNEYLDKFFEEIFHIDTLYSTYKLDSIAKLKYYAFVKSTVVKEIPKIFQNETVETIKKAANFYSLYNEKLKGIDINCNSLLWYELLKKGEVDLNYLKSKRNTKFRNFYF